MPLTELCQEYIGRQLFVVPYYGHGWKNLRSGRSELIEAIGPEPFHIEVKALIVFECKFVGVTGTIKEPSHPLNSLWCVCLLRTVSESNFTQTPGDYLTWIAERELCITPASDKALYEWVSSGESDAYLHGYATVAETKEHVRDTYEMALATRRRLGGT